jgi:hypothetical protein
MRRPLAALVLALLAAILVLAPAAAVLHGEPDGNRHPYVGGLVTVLDGEYFLICTGTMISDTVFLTAAHCTDFIEANGLPTFVTFESEFADLDPDTLIAGTPYTHPEFDIEQWPYTPDIAVVVLDQAPGVGTAQLPEAGLLDQIMAEPGWRQTQLTLVGYGSTGRTRGGGRPQQVYPDIRMFGSVWLRDQSGIKGLAEQYLFHTGNKGRGGGATCFGDSGGPNFLGGAESDLILAVTSGIQTLGPEHSLCGNSPHEFAYRLDTEEARAFLAQFVTLP